MHFNSASVNLKCPFKTIPQSHYFLPEFVLNVLKHSHVSLYLLTKCFKMIHMAKRLCCSYKLEKLPLNSDSISDSLKWPYKVIILLPKY